MVQNKDRRRYMFNQDVSQSGIVPCLSTECCGCRLHAWQLPRWRGCQHQLQLHVQSGCGPASRSVGSPVVEVTLCALCSLHAEKHVCGEQCCKPSLYVRHRPPQETTGPCASTLCLRRGVPFSSDDTAGAAFPSWICTPGSTLAM